MAGIEITDDRREIIVVAMGELPRMIRAIISGAAPPWLMAKFLAAYYISFSFATFVTYWLYLKKH